MHLPDLCCVRCDCSEASGAFQDTTRFPCGARRTLSAGAGTLSMRAAAVMQAHILYEDSKLACMSAPHNKQQQHIYAVCSSWRKFAWLAQLLAAFMLAGLAYVVPTAVGRCRRFHTGLQTKSALQAAAAGSSSNTTLPLTLPNVRMWVKSKVNQLKPTWMQHMFSHVLDADIAIQARVNYNR